MSQLKIVFSAAFIFLIWVQALCQSDLGLIVNKYAKVTDFPSCSPCSNPCNRVLVDDPSGFAPGDKVLLIQMKGVDISWQDDSTFGEISDYASAGFHEVLTIAAVSGSQISFTTPIGGNYNVAGKVQLVKNFYSPTDYTVASAGLTCAPWDGDKGGVLFIEVNGTLTLNGDINVTGNGFRGGLNPNSNNDIVQCGTGGPPENPFANGVYYLDESNLQWAGRKGEGVAEFRNPQYSLGKGPLANGGGGGLNHNAGGGGGGNMGAGGQGGGSYIGFSNEICGKDANGLGGKVLDRMGGLRMFLGGGGGAGHENNHRGNSGGDGGGIIIIKAKKIEGNNYRIISDGYIGVNYAGVQGGPGDNDGGGGGGAGGSIKIECNDFGTTALTVRARGGNGGSLTYPDHGPGGGGGGGLICFSAESVNNSLVKISSSGGFAGADGNNSPYGAEGGEPGLTAYGCSSVSIPPPKLISFSAGADQVLCNPATAVMNTKLDHSQYTFTWFKDGAPIPGATDSAYVTNLPGIYVVKVTSAFCSSSDTVVVTKKGNETPVNQTFCSASPVSVTLKISNADPAAKYGWYTAAKGGKLLGTGTSITLTKVTTDTTLYVADTNKTAVKIGPDGSDAQQYYYVGGPGGADITLQEHNRKFNVYAPVKLKSVEVRAALNTGGCGYNNTFTRSVTVSLYQNNTFTGKSATATVGCDIQTKVPLNFDLDPGNNYELRVDGLKGGDFLLNSQAEMFTIPTVFTISSNMVTSGPFFNWEIEYGSACGRIPVWAKRVCPPIVPGTIAADQTVCPGEIPKTFTSIALPTGGTGSGYTYQWQSSLDSGATWSDISGATSEQYTSPAVTKETWYRRAESCPDCGVTTTNYVAVTLRSKVDAGKIGKDMTLCYGATPDSLVNLVAPSGGAGAGSYTYSWESSPSIEGPWTKMANSNSIKYIFPIPSPHTDTMYYRRVVTSGSGTCSVAATLPVAVNVYPELTPGTLATDPYICYNTEPVIKEATPSSGGNGNYTFQWEMMSKTGATWVEIAGAVKPGLTYLPLKESFYFRRKTTSGDCPSVYTEKIKVTVKPELTAGVIADTQTVCYNTTPKAFTEKTAASGGLGTGSYTYQWQASENGTVWKDIEGATSNVYSSPALIKSTWFRRVVTSSPCGTVHTDSILVKVLPELTPGAIAASQTICYNTVPGPLTETQKPAGGTGAYSYTWQSSPDGISWTNEMMNSSSPAFNPAALKQNVYYRRKVSSGTCQPEYSDTILITVGTVLDAGVVGTGQTICYNSVPVTFTELTAPSGSEGSYTYQWQSSEDNSIWTNINGATGAEYTSGALTKTTWFRRNVSAGTCPGASSPAVEVKVNPSVKAGVIGNNQTICANTTPDAFIEVTPPAGGDGSYTYSWIYSPASSDSWTVIDGASSPAYTPDPVAMATKYRRIVNSQGCAPDTSNTVTISLLPGLDPGTISADQKICYNTAPAMLTATAPSGGTGTYAYLWQVSADGGATWKDITGATGSSYTPAQLTDTAQFRRKVVSGTGSCNTAYTTPVTIEVYPELTPGTIGSEQELCANATPEALTSIELPSGGSGSYSYKWQYSKDNENWSAIPLVTTVDYNPGKLSLTTWFRRLVVDQCGTQETEEVQVTINPLLIPYVTITGNNDICQGESVTFTIVKEDFQGAGAIYHWQINGSDIAGETDRTFTSTTLANGDEITITLTSGETCASPATVTSNKVKMKVGTQTTPLVTISAAPATTICAGTSVTFTLQSSGGGSSPAYQWLLNDVAIPGATGTTYTSAALKNSDKLSAVLTSSSICAFPDNIDTSDAIVMTVNDNKPASVIVTPGTPAKVCEGVSFTFTANPVNPGASPGYQWYLNGEKVEGAEGTGVTFTSSTLKDQDKISVVLTSSEICPVNSPDTSEIVTVALYPIEPVKVAVYSMGMVCEGAAATFTADAVSGGGDNPTYVWTVGGIQAGTGPTFSSASLKNEDIVGVTMTSSALCPDKPADYAEASAGVYEIPDVTVTPGPVARICEKDKITLSSDKRGLSYQWLQDGNPVTTGGSGNTYDASTQGTYQVIVVYNNLGCRDTSDVTTVNVIPRPSPTVLNDTTICEGGTVELTAVTDTTAVKWYWNDREINGAVYTTYTASQPGHYTVSEFNGTCRETSPAIEVKTVPAPRANAGEDMYVIEGTTVTLNASGGDLYSWTPANGLSDANIRNPSITVKDHTVLTVTVSLSNVASCSSTDEVEIFIEKPILIPNSFTPNGDGMNDTWEIANLNTYGNCLVEIYNRWGTLVWTSKGYLREWDGTNYRNDELLPVATYYYIIYVNGKMYKQPFRGHVTIVR